LNIEKVLSEAQLSLVIEKILQVLVYLHEKKIILNNLHPNNVFVSNNNDGDILITDVGLNQL
jgi:serine/threonine protein kinase